MKDDLLNVDGVEYEVKNSKVVLGGRGERKGDRSHEENLEGLS